MLRKYTVFLQNAERLYIFLLSGPGASHRQPCRFRPERTCFITPFPHYEQKENFQMKNTKKLVISGVCLALCLLLPFLTGQIPKIGNLLLPMHLPVLICGFIAGPVYGLLVGLIAPILRSLLFGMPPLMPTAAAMAFELAAYGFLTGLLYQKLPKKPAYAYVSLIGAMLGGRIVWGVAAFLLNSALGNPFTLAIFMAGAFTNAVPGIILQLVIIPPIVLALKKAGLTET